MRRAGELSSSSASLPAGAAAAQARTAHRLGHAATAVSLPVAIQVAGDRRAGLHDRRQGGQRGRADAAEEPGRRDELQARRPRGRAGGADRACCWPTACCACPPRCSPNCASWCLPRPRKGAARSIALETFRAPARAEPALPPGAPDRRHDARHRAGRARHRIADLVFALQHRAHADRGDAGAVHPGGEVRRLVRLDHHSRAGGVHLLHRQRHGVAHQVPQGSQRVRFGRPHQGGGLAAELRNRQVLQQRRLRGQALRREPGEAAPRAG